MKVEFSGGDYDVDLTTEELEYLLTEVPHNFVPNMQVFPSLECRVSGTPRQETLDIACSQDSTVIFDPDANYRILFSKDEDGPIVRVFAGLIYELAVSERNFLVTRYDGYSDKIWIRRNDFQAEQMTLGLPGIPIFPHSALAA